MVVIKLILFFATLQFYVSDSSQEEYDPRSLPDFIDVSIYNNISIIELGWRPNVDESSLKFRLVNRQTKSIYLTIGSANTSNMNPNLKFKIITHGWRDSIDSGWIGHMTDEYLKKGDYNVIQVDWYKISHDIYYPKPAMSVYGVAKHIAMMIVELNKTGVPLTNVHVIGHSLGAHIAGLTGLQVQKMVGQKISRVTGLDAAKPLFMLADGETRLDPRDATFVDVIHTDPNKWGYRQPIGTADFYPNAGLSQPGCNVLSKPGCSHNLAYTYFTESINSNRFASRRCNFISTLAIAGCGIKKSAIMGENVDTTTTKGIYVLDVNQKPPYAQG